MVWDKLKCSTGADLNTHPHPLLKEGREGMVSVLPVQKGRSAVKSIIKYGILRLPGLPELLFEISGNESY